jgi:septal ring factor EnvC (AmiA/AmiB activator)
VIYAVFLASLGTIAGMLVLLLWQMKRAASASDECLSTTKRAGDLDLQLAARGRAVEDRDKTITTLEAERARLEAALAVVTKQRDELVSSLKDPHAAMSAARDALAGAAGVLPHLPQAAPAGTTPHR